MTPALLVARGHLLSYIFALAVEFTTTCESELERRGVDLRKAAR
jgi:hypothetical protein